MLGATVLRRFEAPHGTLKGLVVEHEESTGFRVLYTDGDCEDVTLRELKTMVLRSGVGEEEAVREPAQGLPGAGGLAGVQLEEDPTMGSLLEVLEAQREERRASEAAAEAAAAEAAAAEAAAAEVRASEPIGVAADAPQFGGRMARLEGESMLVRRWRLRRRRRRRGGGRRRSRRRASGSGSRSRRGTESARREATPRPRQRLRPRGQRRRRRRRRHGRRRHRSRAPPAAAPVLVTRAAEARRRKG